MLFAEEIVCIFSIGKLPWVMGYLSCMHIGAFFMPILFSLIIRIHFASGKLPGLPLLDF